MACIQRKIAFFSLFMLLLTPVLLLGQTNTGQLAGTVTDPIGAAVPGATVKIHNMSIGLDRSTTTGMRGEYIITSLPTGPYSVTVTAAGFGDYRTDTVITVGGVITIDVKLAVKAQAQTVQVSGESTNTSVNTTDQEVSQVISPHQLMDLPSLTRNPYDFVALSGNVIGGPTGGNGATGSQGLGVSFSGLRSASTEILMDGVENVDSFSATAGETIPLDSVQEYRVITSGFTAQYGRASGGVVNLVTKSGTNTFHGSLYEYNRVSDLAANTYNEDATDFYNKANGLPLLPHDHFTRNQFGYSIGGPVLPMLKDKLFFFSNTEWIRIRSAGSQQNVIVTPAFLATAAPATQAFFSAYGKLASGVTLGQTVSVPGFSGPPPFQVVNYTVPTDSGAGPPQNTWENLERIDYNLSDKTLMFFRYALDSDDLFAGTNAYSPYNGYDTGSTNYDQASLFSIDHVFSHSLVSSSKVSFNRLNDVQPLGTAPVGPTLYFNKSNTTSFDNVTSLPIAMPGYLPFSPGSAIPFGGPQNFYQFGEDLNYTKSSHSVHVGGQFIQLRDNRMFGAYENAVEQVASSSLSEVQALQQLQQGNIFTFNGAVYPQGEYPCSVDPNTGKLVQTPACTLTLPVTPPSFVRENTYNDGNVYGQDTWKVTPRFTVDLGLRWEYYGVQHNSDPNLESNFYLGTGSTYFQQIRSGQVLTTPNSPVGGIMKQQFHNYAPRIGFAWDIFGDGKWSVRGGFGLSYERNFGNVTYNVIQNPPNYAVVSIESGIAGFGQLPIYTNNSGPLAGTGTAALPPSSLRAPSQTMPVAYAAEYNLAVEHQLARNTVATIQYTGTRGIHQYSLADVNLPYFGNVFMGDANPGNRINYQYSGINVRGANGDSYYQSVNVGLETDRFAENGLQMTVNYTYAHSQDNTSNVFSESSNDFNLGYLNPFNPSLDRGNSDYDNAQNLSLSALYQPNYMALLHASPTMRNIFGGLEFAPIFFANSGTPFSIWDCSNISGYACPRIVNAPGLKFHGTPVNNGGVNSYNYIAIPAASQNPYKNPNPAYNYSDLPTCGTNGCTQNPGMERNQFFGPNTWSFNLGAYKNFALGNRFNAQLRGEFYNILNHHNFYAVTGNADFAEVTSVLAIKGSPSGSPSPSDERRNVQLALRIQF
ncbi:MAG: carboxypeptidase regulatory-like domain-containing protein [Acidobacteriaceae bacterium]